MARRHYPVRRAIPKRPARCTLDSVWSCWTAVAHLLRQRLEPPAVEGVCALQGNRRSRVAGRKPAPYRPPVTVREHCAGAHGGLLGVFLAKAGLAGIIAMVPPNTIPDEAVISLNTPVLL